MASVATIGSRSVPSGSVASSPAPARCAGIPPTTEACACGHGRAAVRFALRYEMARSMPAVIRAVGKRVHFFSYSPCPLPPPAAQVKGAVYLSRPRRFTLSEACGKRSRGRAVYLSNPRHCLVSSRFTTCVMCARLVDGVKRNQRPYSLVLSMRHHNRQIRFCNFFCLHNLAAIINLTFE